MGVPIQKENEAPLGPEVSWEENGEEVSPRYPTRRVWESAMSFPSGVQGRVPAENGFTVI